MTFARRTDANHAEIAGYFQRLGCLVHNTNAAWDLTILKHGIICLIEIKDPDKPPSRRKLTPTSQALMDAGWPIKRIETLDDVMKLCDDLRQSAMTRDGIA